MEKVIYAYTVITNTACNYTKTIFDTYSSLLNSKLSFLYTIFINGPLKINDQLINFINQNKFLKEISLSRKETLTSICSKVTKESYEYKYIVRIDEGDWIEKEFFEEFSNQLFQENKDLFIPNYLINEKNKNSYILRAKNVSWQKNSKLLSEFHGAGTIINQKHAKKGYIFAPHQDRQDGYALWLNSTNSSYGFLEKSNYIYNKVDNSLSFQNSKILDARLNCLKNLFKKRRKYKIIIISAFRNKDSFESYLLENDLCKIIYKLNKELLSLGFDSNISIFGRGGLSGRYKKYYKEFSKKDSSLVSEIMNLMSSNNYEYCCYVNPKYLFTTIEEALTCLLQTIYISCSCGIIIDENEGIISNKFGEFIGLSREAKIEKIQRARQSGIIALKYKHPNQLSNRNYLLDPESCTLSLGSESGAIMVPNLNCFQRIKNQLNS